VTWKKEIEDYILDTSIFLGKLNDVRLWWKEKRGRFPRLHLLFVMFDQHVPAGTAAVERMFEVQTRVHTCRRHRSTEETVVAQLRIISARRNSRDAPLPPFVPNKIPSKDARVERLWGILQSAITLSWFTGCKTFMKDQLGDKIGKHKWMAVIYETSGVLKPWFDGHVLDPPPRIPGRDGDLRLQYSIPQVTLGWPGTTAQNEVVNVTEFMLRQLGQKKKPPLYDRQL
jgi:hypothetical protein